MTDEPAFPSPPRTYSPGNLDDGQLGLTKREWFAGMALAGLAATEQDGAVKYAYYLADAMIEEGKRKP